MEQLPPVISGLFLQIELKLSARLQTLCLKFGNVGLCDGEAASARSQCHAQCHVGFWKLPSQSSAASEA